MGAKKLTKFEEEVLRIREQMAPVMQRLTKAATDIEPGQASPGQAGPTVDAQDALADTSQGSPEETPGEGADPATEQADSPESLAADYAALSDEEFAMHLQAIQMAAAQRGGAGGGPGPDAGAGAPPPPADAGGPPPDMKSEAYAKAEAQIRDLQDRLQKSEAARTEAARQAQARDQARDAELREIRELLAKNDAAVADVARVIAAPILRKSARYVSDVQVVAKPGEQPAASGPDLSKYDHDQIIAMLRPKVRDLSKSDRELVVAFTRKQVGRERVAHLLSK